MSDLTDLDTAASELEGIEGLIVSWPGYEGPAMLQLEFPAEAPPEEVLKAVTETLRTLQHRPESAVLTLPGGGRAVFTGLSVDRLGGPSGIEVTLLMTGQTLHGVVEDQATPTAAATAAVRALGTVMPEGVSTDLRLVEVIERDDEDLPPFVQVAVACSSAEGDEVYLGSAVVRGDTRVAAARAVLDALNRPLERMLHATE